MGYAHQLGQYVQCLRAKGGAIVYMTGETPNGFSPSTLADDVQMLFAVLEPSDDLFGARPKTWLL
jgi:hypothetical protein